MHPFFRSFWVSLLLGWAFHHSGVAQTKGYDVLQYSADLTILRADTSIAGSVAMTAKATRPLGTILQHAKYLMIDSVFVNDVKAEVSIVDTVSGAYHVIAPEEIPGSAEFNVETYYHGKGRPEAGPNAWGGVQHDGNIMYALGVGFHAPYISCTRHWLPCYDLPDDKPDTVYLALTTDTADNVVANGVGIAGWKDINGNHHGVLWKVSHPIATYLLTFAVGDFETITTENPKNIPFYSHAIVTDTARVSALMSRRVVDALAYFDSLFAPYPFEKIGYVVTKLGSMEHQTMINLARAALDTNSTTAVHELAHMWWGDWVTCKDFNDPWLNEGFATYCEALFNERFFGKAEYWKNHKANISGAIATGSTIPLYGTPLTTKPSNNYPTGVLYQKGAAVLGMLRYFIGDSLFFAAVREYGKRHGYSNATSFDLEDAFEDVTGQDLDWFFKKWVFGISYPKLRVNWSRNGNNVTVFFEDTSSTNYFRLPLVIEVRTKSGNKERHIVWLDSAKYSQGSFTASFAPDTIVVDPDGAVMKRIIGQVRLGVDDAGGSRKAYRGERSKLQIIASPNPTRKQTVFLTFTPNMNVHDALLGPEAYDPYHDLFAYSQEPITFLIYDTTGDLKARRTAKRVSDMEWKFECPVDGLSSGSFVAVGLIGSEILASGRFTLEH